MDNNDFLEFKKLTKALFYLSTFIDKKNLFIY